MRLTELRIENLRSVASAELRPGPGLNLITGANGAGKTTVLEAVFLLSRGRSFRSGRRGVLGRRGGGAPSVFARTASERGSHALGVGWEGGRWQGRVDGVSCGSLADLARRIAVTCFQPGSHELISGGSEERRGFIDWAVFHVEPEFLVTWRRTKRALDQRNALLKTQGSSAELEIWEREISAGGEMLDRMRLGYMQRMSPVLADIAAALIPELGAVSVAYEPGWDRELGLDAALRASRGRDLMRGHSSVGPHRADWSVGFAEAPQREHLSRGQEKLCALACILAQTQLFVADTGEWPILCLDDLGSELDEPHLAATLRWFAASSAQILLTTTELRGPLLDLAPSASRFHVEQGAVSALL